MEIPVGSVLESARSETWRLTRRASQRENTAAGISMNDGHEQRLEELVRAAGGHHVEPGVDDEQGGRGRGRELHPGVHPEGVCRR